MKQHPISFKKFFNAPQLFMRRRTLEHLSNRIGVHANCGADTINCQFFDFAIPME